MTTSDVTPASPKDLFRRAKVTATDERVFIVKLLVAYGIWVAGAVLVLVPEAWPARVLGVVLIGAMYAHWLELQHQCLHHSAFRRARWHRLAGVPLGIPMLVSYSHYRVRHLQHHRYLGTDQDSEFFGFDSRQPVTWPALVREALAFGRLGSAVADIVRCWAGRWSYDMGQISESRQREVVAEYRLFAVPILGAIALALLGYGEPVLWIWLLPLLVAVPLHFLVELPEHILCDNSSTDVLRNTRSITGSWFSTWYTNGNNLHIEHHAAMVVPINQLRERHDVALAHAAHTSPSYPQFFRAIAREAQANARAAREGGRP
ncbi:fatty acid desaturase family protein [Streptomyces sp. CBMA123]|uniref:fatty acid desaturase family protein n=1 Tax=Streptomyces sp. CBMA123 TaxID=1896313 RepID=UPI0016619F22|nr:fatty acid desaturase [Streptomyces sp. CBMA123]MBD0693647.1 stearoyl-CoA 9-desaturase [Streptomyces sp. CBMA123]